MVDKMNTPKGEIELEKPLSVGDILEIDFGDHTRKERLVYFEDGVLYFVRSDEDNWEEKLKTHLTYDRDDAEYGKFTHHAHIKYEDVYFTIFSSVGIKKLNEEIKESDNVEVYREKTNLKLDI